MRTANTFDDPMMRPRSAQQHDSFDLEPDVPFASGGRTSPIPLPEHTTALVTAPSDDLPEPDMTRQEAEAMTQQIRDSEAMKRIWVYLIWRRSGWKHLNPRPKSFEDWCLNWIDTPPDTAQEWCRQVKNTLDAKALKTVEIQPNEKEALLPMTQTKLLQKLPTAEARRQAYLEIEGLKTFGTRTPGELQKALKHIVTRMTKPEQSPAVTAQQGTAPVEPVPTATPPVDPPVPVPSVPQRTEVTITSMNREGDRITFDMEAPDGTQSRTCIDVASLRHLLQS
jgi:hypothetical protein